MNTNDFLEDDFEVIGHTKNSVVLLSKRHKCSINVKIDDIQMLLIKLVAQYHDVDAKNTIEEMLNK